MTTWGVVVQNDARDEVLSRETPRLNEACAIVVGGFEKGGTIARITNLDDNQHAVVIAVHDAEDHIAVVLAVPPEEGEPPLMPQTIKAQGHVPNVFRAGISSAVNGPRWRARTRRPTQ